MYTLFADSDSTGVTINPGFDFIDESRKFETTHRARSGAGYSYKVGMRNRFKFSVKFVDSSFAAKVNSAWSENTNLFFVADSSDLVYRMRIQNRETPINQFIKPFDDLYGGTIELESYRATGNFCIRRDVPIGDYGSVATAVTSSSDYGLITIEADNCNIDWGSV